MLDDWTQGGFIMENWTWVTWVLAVMVLGFITFPFYNLEMHARHFGKIQTGNMDELVRALLDINSTLKDIQSELVEMRLDNAESSKPPPDESL